MYEYLQIGRISNTHGVRGEVKVIPLTDDPERFNELEWVFIDKKGSMQKHDVENVKFFKESVILKLSGINTMDEAETLKNCYVLVDRANAVKLPDDTYFICDLIGSSVYDENGKLLGTLEDIFKTGSNDVYVVKSKSGKEILIPALKSVVNGIDIENKRIDVIVPKGLLDE